MQVFAGGCRNIFIDCKYQKWSLLLVCLINIIFGANSNSVKMSSAPANRILHCEHCKSYTSPQVYLIWEPVSDFKWPHCVKRVHTMVHVWLWGCYLNCYFYTWHVAVAMTWQPTVSSLYSNSCLETLILDESHLLLLLSHQSHKICSFLVLNVYGILCLNILLISFWEEVISSPRNRER